MVRGIAHASSHANARHTSVVAHTVATTSDSAIHTGRPSTQTVKATSELTIRDGSENLRPCTEKNTRAPCAIERHAEKTGAAVRGIVDRHASAPEHLTDAKEDGSHTVTARVRQYGMAPVCGYIHVERRVRT